MLLSLSHGATLVAIALRSNKRSHLQLSLSSCYITWARSSSRRIDWGAAKIGPNWSSRASLEIANSGRKTSGQEPMQTQRCAVITGVARSRGIGRQLAYSFINQVPTWNYWFVIEGCACVEAAADVKHYSWLDWLFVVWDRATKW